MGQDPSPSESSNQEDTVMASNQEDNTMASESSNPENERKKDPTRLRDQQLTPLLDVDEDAANWQNLDEMLADRFARLTERREQLQAMTSESERELVIKMLNEEEASRPQDWSQYAQEHHREEDVSDELKHPKDE